ncbi:MAG: precorrin-8X methylmutase [Lachnospiraceae bacterium]|nr:precorrin-8X methylmutase [Lachnospiraceae bacterium]
MKRDELNYYAPAEIEKRSFAIITEELAQIGHEDWEESKALVIKRAIHTTADFSYAENLMFSEGAVEKGLEALKQGSSIITDTSMAMSGINQRKLAELGGSVHCYMHDEEVAKEAKARGITRAAVSMEHTAGAGEDYIYAIGNAPTALVALYDLVKEGRLHPKLIIGVPVGFVNVVEAKELIMQLDVPYIVARGRKGGSNVAAAICNALLYQTGSGAL